MFWQVMDHPGVGGHHSRPAAPLCLLTRCSLCVWAIFCPKRMAAWAEKASTAPAIAISKNPDGSLAVDGICLVAVLKRKDRDGPWPTTSASRCLQRCRRCANAGAGLHRNDRTQVNSHTGSFADTSRAIPSIRGLCLQNGVLKMLKTAHLPYKNGQNAENSKVTKDRQLSFRGSLSIFSLGLFATALPSMERGST